MSDLQNHPLDFQKTLNMFVTVFLGCLVGVVIVAQTLYTSTMEHLKEFATVKAMGGTNADIYRIVSKQALIAGVVGYGVGAVLTVVLHPLIAALELDVSVTPGFAALVFAGTLGFCLLAAALSFHKVAALDPALVFRG